jgi:hypothetical protein
MSVADFFDLKFTLKKMIEDSLGPVLERLEIISERLNDMEIRVDLNRQEIVNLRNEFNIFQTTTNNSINNLTTRVTTL